MILLLIVGVFMIIWYKWCWVVMLMIIHAMSVAICVVVIKLLLFDEFCEYGLKMEKFDFGELEWNDDGVVMN